MAAVFRISDDESEEEHQGIFLRDPNMNPPTRHPVGGRSRLNSESQVFSLMRDGQHQQAVSGDGDDGASGDGAGGAPFRVRSQSAPPALWAAMKYGRQLRRMSDEFDSWLDSGEMRRVKAAAMPHSRSWWSYLFSHKESEVETNSLHPDSHSNRTE